METLDMINNNRNFIYLLICLLSFFTFIIDCMFIIRIIH